ncbi:MAG TPA: hypothetical protein VFI17_03595 [Solirubrobacterales bacterium]|nr:hypothetical protein [Solirubrobacterales bacterium]
MDGRTIATHGGGDLVIGGGPPIDGVLHAWYYAEGQRGSKGAYGIMLGHKQAEQLQDALERRLPALIRTFNGTARIAFTGELACIWFYAYGETTPEKVMRLHESAIDVAIDAIGQALNPMAPAPVGLHDACLSGGERQRLEALMAPAFDPRRVA